MGIMIDVISGGHNGAYDELMISTCWHIGLHDDYLSY